MWLPLVARAGIGENALTNIDEVDDILCALAAQALACGPFHACGDADSDFIVTIEWSHRDPTAPPR